MQQNGPNIPNLGGMYNKSPQNVVNNSPQNQVNDLHIVNGDNGVSLVDIPPVLRQAPNPNAPQKSQMDNNITDIDKQNQIIGLVERWGQVLNSTQIEQGLTEKLLLGPTSTNHLSTMFKFDVVATNEALADDEKLNDKEIEYIKEKLQSLETPTGHPTVDLHKGEVPLWALEQLGAELIKEGKIKESNFLLKAYEKNIKLNEDKAKTIAYLRSFIGYGLTIAGLVALFAGGSWTLSIALIGVGISVMAIIGIFQKLHDRSKTKGEKNLADSLKDTLDTLKNNAGKNRDHIKQKLQNKIYENKTLKEQKQKLQQDNQKLQQDNQKALQEKDDTHQEEIEKLNKNHNKKVEDITKAQKKITEGHKLEINNLKEQYKKTLDSYEQYLHADKQHHEAIHNLCVEHKYNEHTPITVADGTTNWTTNNITSDQKIEIFETAINEMKQHHNYKDIKQTIDFNLKNIQDSKKKLK